MFRTTPAALLHLFLSIIVVAAVGLAPGLHADTRYPDDPQAASLITRDHVRMQLDWRSYYLNRLVVRRHGLLHLSGSWQRPTQAGVR